METNINATVSWYSLNGSSSVEEPPPTILIVVLLTFIVWIILSNALILACLLVNQHALKHCVNFQILSLSITDLLTGIFALLLTLSYKITVSFPIFETCAVIWYCFFTSQTASLFHAFGICIHRLVTIKKRTFKSDIAQKGAYKKIFLEVILIWIASAVMMAVPFVAYGQFGKSLKQCSYNDMFEHNYNKVGIMTSVISLTPQIGMTIVYIYIFRFLVKTWRRTNIMRTVPNPTASDFGKAAKTCETELSDQKSAFQGILLNTENPRAKQKPEDISALNNESVDTIPLANNGSEVSEEKVNLEKSELKVPVVDNLKSIRKGNAVSHGNKTSDRASYTRQIHVLITIGLLILVMNICITPLNCMGLVEVKAEITLERQVKAIFVCVSFLNSALNPFIYALRVKPFRTAMASMFKK